MVQNFQIRKIIALTNLPGRQSLQAALWADYFAAAFQSQVVLYDTVAPIETDQDIPMQEVVNHYGVLLQSSFSRLKRLAQHVTRANQVRHVSELGVPATNLIYQAQHEDADLIILNVPGLAEEIPTSTYELLYSSPCPVFFARSLKVPQPPKKILVPVRLKHGLEQKMPAVIALAKAFHSTICLSAFEPYSASIEDKHTIELKINQMRTWLRNEGIKVETETVHGRHFGEAMLQSVEACQADMLAIVVEPSNYMQRLLKKMMGKYFLENCPVPVLAVPILRRNSKVAKQSSTINHVGSAHRLYANAPSMNFSALYPPFAENAPMRHS